MRHTEFGGRGVADGYPCTVAGTSAVPCERVVLVDAHDRPVGTAEKLDAHRRGLRHRAISVFLFNGRGETLLQQRAIDKYHSPGRWANACCSHPRIGEAPAAAAARRLEEELGIRSPLRLLLTTAYRAPVGSGLVEDEFCHVFVGGHSGAVSPNPAEVADTRWLGCQHLRNEVACAPHQFAAWLRIYLEQFEADLCSAAQQAERDIC